MKSYDYKNASRPPVGRAGKNSILSKQAKQPHSQDGVSLESIRKRSTSSLNLGVEVKTDHDVGRSYSIYSFSTTLRISQTARCANEVPRR
jgi:hypothetical protein